MGGEQAPRDSFAGPSSGSWGAGVARALRESLEAYCTPDVCATIVQTALARVQLIAPPEAPNELAEFVRDYLAPEVEERLGHDAAAELVQRFAGVLGVLDRATRSPPAPLGEPTELELEPEAEGRATLPTSPPASPTPLRATRGDETRPFTSLDTPALAYRAPVLGTPSRGVRRGEGDVTLASERGRQLAIGVLTGDTRLISHARVALGSGGTTVGFATLSELARIEPGTLDVVIVDRRGVDPSTPPTVPRALAGVHVVLWPADRALALELETATPELDGVSAYGTEVGIEDVIALVRLALGTR